MLSERRVTQALDKYYLGMTTQTEELTDAWYTNPAPNIWKFERRGKIHILTCDLETGEVACECKWGGVEMTKQELRAELAAGRTLDELFRFKNGQECMIFKADYFTPRAEIIYIPDIDLNEIPVDDPITDPEVLTDVLHYCYTGEDFVEACGGNVWKAERLFWYVDWQNPCSAVNEIEDDELDRTQELLQAVVDWMVGALHRRVAIATLLDLDFTPDELIELNLGSDNVNEVLAGY